MSRAIPHGLVIERRSQSQRVRKLIYLAGILRNLLTRLRWPKTSRHWSSLKEAGEIPREAWIKGTWGTFTEAGETTYLNMVVIPVMDPTDVWDRNTGYPLRNAIVCQDVRTAHICEVLAQREGQDRFRSRTGLPLSTYFSGPKIRWILENVKGPRVVWLPASGRIRTSCFTTEFPTECGNLTWIA